MIRSKHDRGILIGHDDPRNAETSKLRTYLRTLDAAGTWRLNVTSCQTNSKKKGDRKKVKRIARSAKMAVSFAAVYIKPPKNKNGLHGNDPLKVWVVRVWEVDPPEGQERLEWFLITNEVVASFEAAYRVVGWYERRWIVEEYHKGLKTGCRIESMQFTKEERLKPAIALVSIVTLKLLNLRDASRSPDATTRKATQIISQDYVAVLSIWRHGKVKLDWTIHEFFYALARVGGHQNRKNDHPPGWQTIWIGWKELQAMVVGAETAKKRHKCGQT